MAYNLFFSNLIDYLGDFLSENDLGKYGNFGGSSHPLGKDGEPLSSAQLEGIDPLSGDFGLDQSYKNHDISYAKVREAEESKMGPMSLPVPEVEKSPVGPVSIQTAKDKLDHFSPLGARLSQMKADEELANHHLSYLANTPLATEEQKEQAKTALKGMKAKINVNYFDIETEDEDDNTNSFASKKGNMFADLTGGISKFENPTKSIFSLPQSPAQSKASRTSPSQPVTPPTAPNPMGTLSPDKNSGFSVNSPIGPKSGPVPTSLGSKSAYGDFGDIGGYNGTEFSGFSNTGGSGGGKAHSLAEVGYNAAQGGMSDPSMDGGSGSGADNGADASGWSGGSDAGMGSAPGGMGLGSDTEGAGGWGFPVVLDLDGDGRIEIIPPHHSPARFDMDGDGRRQVLAWIGSQDGLLVYDRDGDRLISHKQEIAFKDYLATAKTDLEGLAWFDQLAQGGNEDGVLDARDAEWSKFGVWQDVDQDGKTDPGELRMTSEGGLQAVDLTSDQKPIDAGPDAKIFGRGSYEYLDGDGIAQRGDLFDTALRYENPEVTSKPSEASQQLPPLVRLDGQPLKGGEVLYPDMAYRENKHAPWPAWAIERATENYPELTKQIAASRLLAKDQPEDLLDPDYHMLPENPDFRDAWRHARWKVKKYGTQQSSA